MTDGVREKFGRRKWYICGLLLLATLLNYLDRQVLSLTAERVIAEFHTDKEGYGMILASFRYSYAAVQFFGGWIVDAYGARLVFPAAVAFLSFASTCTVFAPTQRALMVCRSLRGAGEAFNWPCALNVTGRLIEPKDRPLANGIFNSGTAMGALIAPLIVTVLTIRMGWRSAFVVSGALGLIWILLWAALTRDVAPALAGRRVEVKRVPGVLFAIARKREFWLLATSSVVVNSASYFLADWIPLYLKTERGFAFGSGNLLSMLIYAGFDVGNLLPGILVGMLVKRRFSVGAARNLSLLLSCCLMTFAIAVGSVQPRFLALSLLVLTAAGVSGFLVIYLTLIQDIDPLHVGATAGMLGGVGNLAYGLFTPLIGRLSDLHQTGSTFLLLGLLPWLAFLTIFPVARRSRS